MSPLPETPSEESAIEKWLRELSLSCDKSAGIGGLHCKGDKGRGKKVILKLDGMHVSSPNFPSFRTPCKGKTK